MAKKKTAPKKGELIKTKIPCAHCTNGNCKEPRDGKSGEFEYTYCNITMQVRQYKKVE